MRYRLTSSPWEDVSWYMTDSAGNVAMLASNGGGAHPEGDGSSQVHEWAMAQPRDGRAASAKEVPTKIWHEFAERGLFAYDFDEGRGRYVRVAVPERPRTLEGGDIHSVNGAFADMEEIDTAAL